MQINKAESDRAPPASPYRLYVFDISYFSGKLEAYMRYKGLPYERVEPGWRELASRIYRNTGWMKLPVVETREGLWLQDSTPIIEWLEARHATPAVIPREPVQRFFSYLLEDYADEWMWRPALHYRWSYEPDASLYIQRFLREFLYDAPSPDWLTGILARRRQMRTYVVGDGVNLTTRSHVEGIYRDTLARLQAIFVNRPYLLGDLPTLADFGFFASMFRHFSLDPTPARIMRETAPAVYEWTARLWNQRARRAPLRPVAAPGRLPADWKPFFVDMSDGYLEYLHANAAAFRAGKATFDATLQGTLYRRLPVVQYRVWLREVHQQRLLALRGSAEKTVRKLLEEFGCLEPLERDGIIASNYDNEGRAPVRLPHKVGRLEQLWRLFTGTDWNLSSIARLKRRAVRSVP